MLKMYNMINKRLPSWQDPPSSSKIRVRCSVCSAVVCQRAETFRDQTMLDPVLEACFHRGQVCNTKAEFVDLRSVKSNSKMMHTLFS